MKTMSFLINHRLWLLSLGLLAVATPTHAESFRLTNVISNGTTGNQPVEFHLEQALGATPAERMQTLEAMRQAARQQGRCDSCIEIGVDVNESANGTEKSESQAVALKSVRLDVTLADGSSQSLMQFSTLTKSLLAEGNNGPASRQPFFTLLGSSGSNEITGSSLNEFQKNFDSTIQIDIPAELNLSQAVEATLHIDLVNTNTKLGDPEQFYDYSNGFEDLALLDYADARFLDIVAKGIIANGEQVAAGGAEPISLGAPVVIDLRETDAADSNTAYIETPYVEWLSYPSSSSYYLVGYEDLFPNIGDYDFNDLITAYRVDLGLDLYSQVTQIRGEAILVSRGGVFNHDWHLRFKFSQASGSVTESLYRLGADGYSELIGDVTQRSFTNATELDLLGFDDTALLFPAPEGCRTTNTEARCGTYVPGPKYIFNIKLDTPIDPADLSRAPFDPYLWVQTNYEVHIIGETLASQREAMGYSATKNATTGLGDSFVDGNNYPFAMILPTGWQPPRESRAITDAYPFFEQYVQSQGRQQQDWYTRPDTTLTLPPDILVWQW